MWATLWVAFEHRTDVWEKEGWQRYLPFFLFLSVQEICAQKWHVFESHENFGGKPDKLYLGEYLQV